MKSSNARSDQTTQAESGGRSRLFRLSLPVVVLASVAVLSLLVSACGGRPSSATAGGSTQQSAALAYAHCMRSHGVANFPDPDPQGHFPTFHSGVSKHTLNAAQQACQHLLSSGGGPTTQASKEKLDFGLNVAQCMHSHGYPTYPEPAVSSNGSIGVSFTGTGIDAKSTQFLAAQTTCEKRAQQAYPNVTP